MFRTSVCVFHIQGVVQPANLCRDEEDREKMVDDLYVDDIIKG